MEEAHSRNPNVAVEFALLLPLATLWGASYTFIKLGVATIPPVTLIAARTSIAGLLLPAIMRARGTAQAYLRVPIGVALGVAFLGESLTSTAWIGLAWVVIGVAAMTMPARKVAVINASS
jgi:drug/metabolite transporter (DMT)-like permease